MYLGLVAPMLRVHLSSCLRAARSFPRPITSSQLLLVIPHAYRQSRIRQVIPAPPHVIPAKAGFWRPTSDADSSGRHRLDTSNGATFPILPGIHRDGLGRRALEVKGWIPAFAGMTSGGGG